MLIIPTLSKANMEGFGMNGHKPHPDTLLIGEEIYEVVGEVIRPKILRYTQNDRLIPKNSPGLNFVEPTLLQKEGQFQ